MNVSNILERCNISIVKDNKSEIQCLCPFHEDSKPSLNVNSITGAWQCWANCGRGKNIYSLVAKCLGINYDAAKIEVDKGFSPEMWEISFRKKLYIKDKAEQESKLDLSFIKKLPSAIGNAAEEYLRKRGFTRETIEFWGVLFFPENCGIIIPIESKSGELQGYLFRRLDRKEFKYSAGFKSGQNLFGINHLVETNNTLTIVEGPLDAIWCWQCGITNVLSTFTCSVSDEQVNLLCSLGTRLNIMYDGDLAGYAGAKGAAEKLKDKMLTKIVQLPKGKDPNDCTKEELLMAVEKSKYTFLERID